MGICLNAHKTKLMIGKIKLQEGAAAQCLLVSFRIIGGFDKIKDRSASGTRTQIQSVSDLASFEVDDQTPTTCCSLPGRDCRPRGRRNKIDKTKWFFSSAEQFGNIR